MLTCVLCHQPVNLLDLDNEGWMGEPAHEVCARAARAAASAAIDRAAAEQRQRLERKALARGAAVA